MGVYIKGMEMPQDYAVVVKIFPDGSVGTIPYIQFFKVDLIEGAQAVPVPPHGDLIDRDAAAEKIWDDMRFPSNLANAQFFVNELREMPTIIPAEEGDE